MSIERYVKSVPPGTEMIQSMINADMSLKMALAELVANSLDQDATSIDIRLNTKPQYKEEIVFSDNGKGCPNLELMVKLGSHVPSKKNSIGRHGVGFKDAVIWLGDSVIVDSLTKGGKKERADANWELIKALGKWDIGFSDDTDRRSHGVTITIGGLRRRRITQGWKNVLNYIAELFSAAIDDGVIITVDGVRVKSVPIPLLVDEVPFLIQFNGRIAKGFCGILVDKSIPSGWNVRYQTQTIVSNYKNDGFGDQSSHGFWGMLYMIDGENKWQLTRNKTASENLADVLDCSDMQAVVRPLLEKIEQAAKQMSMNLSHQLVMEELNGMLRKIKAGFADGNIVMESKSGQGDEVVTPISEGQRRGKDKEPRKKRGAPKDALSQTKELFRGINRVIVRPTAGNGKSLGEAMLISRGTLLMVEIENSTEIGRNICENPSLLRHTAVTLIALLFGTREDLPFQLSFNSLSEMPPLQNKISLICAWLLKHVNFDELKSNSGAA